MSSPKLIQVPSPGVGISETLSLQIPVNKMKTYSTVSLNPMIRVLLKIKVGLTNREECHMKMTLTSSLQAKGCQQLPEAGKIKVSSPKDFREKLFQYLDFRILTSRILGVYIFIFSHPGWSRLFLQLQHMNKPTFSSISQE